MCVRAVPPAAAAGRAGGFPALPPGPRAGRARAARGGPRGSVPCPAGVPGACLCVLDCKGKWLTAPFLLLLPLPVLSGAASEDGVSGRGVQPPHPQSGAGSAPGARRPQVPGFAARRSAGSRPVSFPVSFYLTPNAITEVE